MTEVSVDEGLDDSRGKGFDTTRELGSDGVTG